MTDFTNYTDEQLQEALAFHRRQRNLTRGMNESANMRSAHTVRLLEAEEARRLTEEKPNHYIVSKRKNGEYGVSQDVGNNVWDHSYHHGTHKTVDAAKAWAMKHAGKYPHKIEVKEEADLNEGKEQFISLSDVKKHVAAGKTVKYHVLHGGKDAAGRFDDYESAKKGAAEYRSKMRKNGYDHTGVAIHPVVIEEVEQLDEIGDTAKGKKALKAVISRAPEKAANLRMKSDILGRRQFDPDVGHENSEKYGKASDKAYKQYQLATKSAARAVDRLTKEEVELSENVIKGWKNAASDIAKHRSRQAAIARGEDPDANKRKSSKPKYDEQGTRDVVHTVTHSKGDRHEFVKQGDNYWHLHHAVVAGPRGTTRRTTYKTHLGTDRNEAGATYKKHLEFAGFKFKPKATNESVELDEIAKEYYTVHRAASLTSAQMKGAVSGDQPSFHKTEADAINHLNKKYKKVKDGVWKNSKDQFFFHKKNSSVKEEVELDENEDWKNDTLSGKYKSREGVTAEVSKHSKKGYWNVKIPNDPNNDIPTQTRALKAYINRGWYVKEEVETEKNWVDKVKGDGYTIQKHSKTGKQRTVYTKGETKEEVELDEISASTLHNYVDKARADKKDAMKDRTVAKNNMKKYGMAMDRKDHEDASRRVVNRNTGISVANKKLNTYPTDKAKAKVMAREEVEVNESEAAYKKMERDEKRKASPVGEYWVTDHMNKKTHDVPFKTSDEAIRHADSQETKTGRVHTVHHIKNGKIQKQWQYSDSHRGFKSYSDHAGERSPIHEEMSDAQMKKREEIVKGMKKNLQGFKDRYGKDAKSVMYATATKQAMKEDVEQIDEAMAHDKSLPGKLRMADKNGHVD